MAHMNLDAAHQFSLPQIPVAPTVNWVAVIERFVANALNFSRNQDPNQDLQEGWNTFRAWRCPWINYGCPDWNLFLVWYVFHWKSMGSDSGKMAHSDSLAIRFAKHSGENLTQEEQLLIGAATKGPLDFYEIYRLPEIDRYYVKSLLLGYQYSFSFISLPDALKEGCIFFGKIIPVSEDSGIIAAHSQALPLGSKVLIANLRRKLIKNRKMDFVNDFFLFDSDVFNLYQDVLSQTES